MADSSVDPDLGRPEMKWMRRSMCPPVDSGRALVGDGYPPLQQGIPDQTVDAVHELPLQKWERKVGALGHGCVS
ncbi:hypothetical protein GCM10011408_10880 [Dyella caseinilytica]|nr:hypothetical protein GCM10011408_10880 [Dyella caseinilytica]